MQELEEEREGRSRRWLVVGLDVQRARERCSLSLSVKF